MQYLKNIAKANIIIFTTMFLWTGTRLEKIKDMKTGDIVHVNTGLLTDKATLLKFIKGAKVIYVGETHNNMAAHEVQLEVIKMLKDANIDFVVGMEMFKRKFQDVLDQWSAGTIEEKEFIKDTHWHDEWGMDFRLYRDILIYLRDNKIPIAGLNITTKLRKEFRDGKTSSEDIKEIPKIDYSDELHKEFLTRIFQGHSHMPKEHMKKFYSVQCLWEEYMAESISRYISSPEGEKKKMVVLCGGGHIIFDFGIPKRVLKRTGEPYLTIYNLIKKEEGVLPSSSPFIEGNIKLLPAHFAWLIENKELPPKPRMGVLIEKKDKGVVVIADVVPKSPAKEAGLKKGDILLEVDGKKVEESFDVIYVVNRKKEGDTIKLTVRRDKENLSFYVKLGLHVFKKHHK